MVNHTTHSPPHGKHTLRSTPRGTNTEQGTDVTAANLLYCNLRERGGPDRSGVARHLDIDLTAVIGDVSVEWIGE